jgi:hypothetical protein
MRSVKPKATTLEADEEFVTLVFEFATPAEADMAFDEIGKAMKAGTLVLSCDKPASVVEDGSKVQ